MKILLCHGSELARDLITLALAGAGHDVRAAERPEDLASDTKEAKALLAETGRAKAAIRLLKERGFEGRALVLSDVVDPAVADAEEADGVLAPSPPDDLPSRFHAALAQKRSVLILDDSELAATLLRGELEPKGFTVRIALDAESATSLILKKSTRPDLVLLDINMPRVDGASYCRFLKKNTLFRGIKVILCSGADEPTVKRIAEECGADGYLLKDQILGDWVNQQLPD